MPPSSRFGAPAARPARRRPPVPGPRCPAIALAARSGTADAEDGPRPEARPLLRLQFYVLRRLTANLLLVLLVVSGIMFVGQTVQFMDRMPDVGLGFLVLVLPQFLPVTLALTLPLAFLIALTTTYGRLADDHEILAMRMSGIHPWAFVVPGVFAGALLAFAGLHLHGEWAPWAVAGQERLRRDTYRQFTEVIERGARTSFLNGDTKISWSRAENGVLHDLHLSQGGQRSEAIVELHADRGRLQRSEGGETLVFALERALLVRGDGAAWTPSRFEDTAFSVSAGGLLQVRMSLAKPRALDFRQLLFRHYRLPDGTEIRTDIDTEIWGRLAIALAPFAFALCAIPLALLFGHGSRAGAAVLALGVAVVFYVLWQMGMSLSYATDIPVALAMLSGDIVLGGAGVVLLRRVFRS